VAYTGPSIQVLFVGNSLTYTNDLPALIKELAAMDGISLTYDEILLPDYSLEDHWNDGNVQAVIKKKHYDIMVAQQGPSALPESQELLKKYAQKFADECVAANTQLNLYMVWPSKSRSFDLDNVIVSYTQAALQTGASFSPVGSAWKSVWEKHPDFQLHGPDDFHPFVNGSVLASMIIYASLQKKKDLNFIRYDNASWKNKITRQDFEVLKDAALSTLLRQ
jgi:hypothetical protein